MSYVTKIGHAHLKVRDLGRSVAFYSRYLALHETERVGDAFAFLTGGAFHHEIALQRVGMGAPQPPANATGPSHVPFEVPDRRSFAAANPAPTHTPISPSSPLPHTTSPT